MTIDRDEAMRLAQFWASVSEEHNTDKFQTVLHDDFTMWYNFDPQYRSRAEFVETLKAAHAMFENQKNEDLKITITERGFILQATMTGVLAGENISSPYCFVAEVREGKVYRGEEYFDTAQLTKKAGRPGEGMV
ncbi:MULTISPECIES: nuclear transport factor 2 family protein [Sphingobium]|uniref:nuclear transport factor 2 family protein n=1 Tax=Sphingobium TaxID=165695 RepID=UPI0018D210C4|nr:MULTISPECIES: nuclear transport factor 2 family protein [Sphingobium]